MRWRFSESINLNQKILLDKYNLQKMITLHTLRKSSKVFNSGDKPP
jgi:hypothetical protein